MPIKLSEKGYWVDDLGNRFSDIAQDSTGKWYNYHSNGTRSLIGDYPYDVSGINNKVTD